MSTTIYSSGVFAHNSRNNVDVPYCILEISVLCWFYRRRFGEITIAGTSEVLKYRALCASCEVCHHHYYVRRQWVLQKTFDKITLFLL